MKSKIDEPKRIKKFRLSIAKAIPKFPNDKSTLSILEAKSLADLLIDYANWMSRHVAPRPRKIQIEPTASNDTRWSSLSNEITAFLEKIKKGEDLTSHLSLRALKEGFTPVASTPKPNTDLWADKDFLLNIMGYHHFHLGLTQEPAGHMKRTDDVLFAAVTREQFEIIGLFNHSVFEINSAQTNVLTKEKERLWKIFEERTMRGVSSGSVVVPSMITQAGHPACLVDLADDYARVIREVDQKLDDISFVENLYRETNVTVPKKLKIEWYLNFMDLGLFDKASNVFLYYIVARINCQCWLCPIRLFLYHAQNLLSRNQIAIFDLNDLAEDAYLPPAME